MKKVKVYTAQSFKNTKVEPFTIVSNGEAPNCKTIKEYESFYNSEAEKLYSILLNCLPGGVVDNLTSKLLAHKAVLLITPYSKG